MHQFIVSENTLPVHLEYSFAGVSIDNDCYFDNISIDGHEERGFSSLYADICGVHKGDEILFYMNKPDNDSKREGGRFFGFFECVSDFPFYEPQGNYLKDDLGVPLVFRHKIIPKKIYSIGLTEWQAMDEMSDFKTVLDIPWTLIYRKISGKRGCTPILPHEEIIIKKMLDRINAGQPVFSSKIGYNDKEIGLYGNGASTAYSGRTDIFNKIDNRLKELMEIRGRKWELQLQAYLMQEIKRNKLLTELLFPNVEIFWIGNEIYAGAGMQSIDLLVYTKNDFNTFIHLIELKSVTADREAAAQLNRYIMWLMSHIPDLKIHQIVPTLIAPDASPEFHQELKIYLRGRGINQYRIVNIDNNLNFDQAVYNV